jgi:hypothetical protein
MTARAPLVWLDTDFGEVPDCEVCRDRLWQPFYLSACASVGIERGLSAEQAARLDINQFHANGHRRRQ